MFLSACSDMQAGENSQADLQVGAAQVQDTTQWNFVFILADDLGWNQIGFDYNGPEFYETPNINRIAAEGMYFTAAYAAAPICSPSRASIMAGKYPARLHLTDYLPGSPYPYARLSTPQMAKALPLEEVTIAEVLKEKDYTSGFFGKWHLSEEKAPPKSLSHNPDKQGFDDVFITYKPGTPMAKPWQTPKDDGHNVEIITEKSLAFIEENQDQPFFLFVSHNVVHRPLMEHEELIAKYEKKWGAVLQINNPIMGAMIERMDAGIGRILQKLDELGLAEKTIVIFFSDNGGLELLQDQEPLRGGKAMLWEGGIRVPLAIRWPGVIEPGTKSTLPVISNDFFPTIAEIAGTDPQVEDLDGVSLVPLLKQTGELDREALYWHYPHYHHLGYKPAGAIRVGDYKLIEWYEDALTEGDNPVDLYNLQEDIGEVRDLSDEMPEKAQEMLVMLRQWRERVGAQEMTVNPNYDSERAHLRFETSASE